MVGEWRMYMPWYITTNERNEMRCGRCEGKGNGRTSRRQGRVKESRGCTLASNDEYRMLMRRATLKVANGERFEGKGKALKRVNSSHHARLLVPDCTEEMHTSQSLAIALRLESCAVSERGTDTDEHLKGLFFRRTLVKPRANVHGHTHVILYVSNIGAKVRRLSSPLKASKSKRIA